MSKVWSKSVWMFIIVRIYVVLVSGFECLRKREQKWATG